MKLTFIGAAHEVTGSCTVLEIGGRHILIDYGGNAEGGAKGIKDCGNAEDRAKRAEPDGNAEDSIKPIKVRGGPEGSFGLWTAFEGCAEAG